MQNFTTCNEKTFAGKLHEWMELYSHNEGLHHYAINCALFLAMVRKKYVKVYKRFIEELKIYSKAMISIKRVFTIFPTTTIKTGEIPKRSENSNCKIKQRL